MFGKTLLLLLLWPLLLALIQLWICILLFSNFISFGLSYNDNKLRKILLGLLKKEEMLFLLLQLEIHSQVELILTTTSEVMSSSSDLSGMAISSPFSSRHFHQPPVGAGHMDTLQLITKSSAPSLAWKTFLHSSLGASVCTWRHHQHFTCIIYIIHWLLIINN